MAKWPTDKELEEIYRKGSEQHNFDYDVKSWHQMEDLLEQDRRRKWAIWLLSALLFMGFVGGVYWMNESMVSDTSSEIIQDLQGEGQDQNTQSFSSNRQNIIDEEDGTNVQSLESEESIEARSINESRELSDDNKISSTSPSVTPNEVNQKLARFKDKRSKEIEQKNHLTSIKLASDRIGQNQEILYAELSQTPDAEVRSEIPIIKETEIPTIKKPLLASSFVDQLAIQKFNISYDPFNVPAFAESEEVKHSYSKFTLFAFVGGESSQTPNGSSSSFDPHIGLGGAYLLSRKFGFTLSANYIKDKYKAKADDYKPPTGFWKASGLPQWTDASCDMFELSYGLVYHLSGFDQKGLILNASLNSNFMLSEHYYYNFEDRSENFSSSWSMANKTLLSSISLSANYNLPFQNKWSVQIGPYAKIPIRGIGHGDVMLSSFGMRVYLSLNSL